MSTYREASKKLGSRLSEIMKNLEKIEATAFVDPRPAGEVICDNLTRSTEDFLRKYPEYAKAKVSYEIESDGMATFTVDKEDDGK